LHDFHWRHVYPLYKSYVQAIKDSGSAGEVEANNTMARADWDAGRRREAPPEQTQTVPTAQQIVDVNGLPTQYKGKKGLAPDTVQRVRDLRANGMGATR
jgi:DNA/RNA endonuclease YhcR with UshA esterase domain